MADVTQLNSAGGRVVTRALAALVVYVLSKASVLVAPLLLSTLLPLSQYGLFEYSLSIGQMSSVGLSLGIHGGVPYFLLKRRQSGYTPAFSLHVIMVSAACIVASLLAAEFGQTSVRLVALIAGIAVAQFFAAAKYQSAGRPMESSIAEGCLYLLVLVFAGGAYLNLVARNLDRLCWILTAYLALVLVWNSAMFPRHTRRLRLWRTYKGAARYGVSVLPATFANVGLVSLGRTLVGITGSLEQVAIYSVVYRLSVPLVAIHQFLTNFYFKKLYEGGAREFEKYFCWLTALLFGAAVCLSCVGPRIGHQLIGANASGLIGRTDLFILMGIAMIFWAQLSLMELFMNREARTLVQLPGIAAGCLVTISCILLPKWLAADQVDNVALFQGLGFAVAILWIFHVSGVAQPRWPIARPLVLSQIAALGASWLLVATKWL